MAAPNGFKFNKYMLKKRNQRIKAIKLFAKSHNGKCLNLHHYKNSKFKAKFKCKHKHEFFLSRNTINQNTWCPLCSSNVYKGEEITRIILEEILQIKLPKNRKIPGLISPISGAFLEIDGFNDIHKVGFEYNGKHHYNYSRYRHRKYSEFQKLQKHDEVKKVFFKNKKWKLIVIPEFKKLTIHNCISFILTNLSRFNLQRRKAPVEKIIKRVNREVYQFKYYEKIIKQFKKEKIKLIEGGFSNSDSKITFINLKDSKVIKRKIITLLKRIDRGQKIINYKIRLPKSKKNKKDKQSLLARKDVISIIGKYKYLKDFRKKEQKVIYWLKKNNLFAKLTKKLIRLDSIGISKMNYSLKFLKKIALNYDKVGQFKKDQPRLFYYCYKHKLLDKVFPKNRIKNQKINKIKTKSNKEIIEICQKYSSYSELKVKEPRILFAAYSRKISKEALSHLSYKRKDYMSKNKKNPRANGKP